MLTNLNQLPTLVGQRIRLRWLTEDDVSALYGIFSHPDVAQFWSQSAMKERSEADVMLQSVRDYFQNRSLFQWGVERLDTAGIIGTCTLASLDKQNRRADIGYALNREYWGQGLIGDALTTLLAFAFETLNLHRIEGDVDPRNDRSIRVLERQGFQREGFLRERWIVDGVVQDTALFGLLQREWTGDRNGIRTPQESVQLPHPDDSSTRI
jgi:RimJ/RimL family protein N-acetyltransferase